MSRRVRVSRSLLFTALSLALVAGACGSDDSGASSTTTQATSSTTTTEAPSTTAAPTTTAGPTTSTTTTTVLPGEPFDIFPPAGAVLAVIGVAHDDVLNVRDVPGDGRVIATYGPVADDVVSAGAGWKLPTTIWWKVGVDGTEGWVNSSFLAYLGVVDDVTSQVVAALGGIPEEETMLDLGRVVAEALASDDPKSDIVMSIAPSIGDLGEVTYDVVGIGDDAARGSRLHVFGAPSASGDGFTLKSVEATVLCGRGVTDDGLCI